MVWQFATRSAGPEWSRTIETFRRTLDLSQSELGRRLETSAMAVSGWERGRVHPSADSYIRLGKLAGDPLCWYFWGRAGLSTADVMRVLPEARRRLNADRIATVQIVHAGTKGMRAINKDAFVAIPLLPAWAATPGEKAKKVGDLDQLKQEALLASGMVS